MMKNILKSLVAGQTLSETEMQAAVSAIMSGEADAAQIGALLALLANREPTVDELVGVARVMRQFVLPVDAPDEVIDTCGAGGAGSRLFNISTTAAIVAAACGVPVAKHGNRAVTSRSGSADVLTALGVNVEASPAVQTRCLHEINICFAFAQRHHPSMKHVAAVRTSLGFATIFNLMGPLTNPAGAKKQLAGVPRPALNEKVLAALVRLGAARAMVVCGVDPVEGNLCELSLAGKTHVSLFDGTESRSFTLVPEDVGLKTQSSESFRVDSPAASAQIVREVLAGKKGAARDIILLNAGAALWVGQKARSVREGIKKAATAIDKGAGAHTLNELIRLSNAS
ncbi:MAG: anthranilate phosphoribosyltransferase [Phycisphaerae bacterium]